jgi:hypothetical protein
VAFGRGTKAHEGGQDPSDDQGARDPRNERRHDRTLFMEGFSAER